MPAKVTSPISKPDIAEHVELLHLLPSQREFIFNPAQYKFFAGGFRMGKSRAMCTAGLLLSAWIPGNVGAVFCYRGTDVEARLKPIFDEIIPETWLRSYHKQTRTYVLRNNSLIMLRHLHDSGAGTNSAAKTRRIGMNLGWLGVDQLEECQPEHWKAIISRLSLTRAKKKFAFATLNPNGHDWIWEKAFTGMQPWPLDASGKSLPLNGNFYQLMQPDAKTIGIVGNSEENRISNGGFIEDAYFDSIIDQYDQAWRDRYVYSKFDEFKGKILPEYESGAMNQGIASVHNVKPFDIPRNWECVVGIDVGGDCPWGIVPVYVDEYGNLIVTPGFHERTAQMHRVVSWYKNVVPWNSGNRVRNVIDPENKVAVEQFLDHGIVCQLARKEVLPGLLRMNSYFHVQKYRELPDWYIRTQDDAKILRFKGHGSPQIFIMESATYTRRELDTAKWHPDKPNEMWKNSTQRFDAFEALRYVCMAMPEASKPDMSEDKYAKLQAMDPLTAREWRERDAHIKAMMDAQKGGLRDMEAEEMSNTSGKYDYSVQTEW